MIRDTNKVIEFIENYCYVKHKNGSIYKIKLKDYQKVFIKHIIKKYDKTI